MLANPLWAMATTFGVVPEVFGSMCRAAAPKVQGVNAQVLANTLWAMTTTFQVVPEVSDSIRRAAAPKVQGFSP